MLEAPFLRLDAVLAIIPLGKTAWWQGVRTGRFPQPIRISSRAVAWRAADLRTRLEAAIACLPYTAIRMPAVGVAFIEQLRRPEGIPPEALDNLSDAELEVLERLLRKILPRPLPPTDE